MEDKLQQSQIQQTGRGGQSKWQDKCREQLCDRSWARLLLPTEHKESIVAGPGLLIPAHSEEEENKKKKNTHMQLHDFVKGEK